MLFEFHATAVNSDIPISIRVSLAHFTHEVQLRVAAIATAFSIFHHYLLYRPAITISMAA
jgi:hypothetical protein